MSRYKIRDIGKIMNASSRLPFLFLLMVGGIIAVVFGGAEFFVTFVVGALLWAAKYVIMWKGSGERISFTSYFFGETSQTEMPWRRKNDVAGRPPSGWSKCSLKGFVRGRLRK
jgi:hypothetical protein